MGKVGSKAKAAGVGAGKARAKDTNPDPATITVYSDGTSSFTPGGKGAKKQYGGGRK